MSAVGVAVPIAEAHVNMQVRVALVIVADDAAAGGQLDGAGQVQHLAVAVAGLLVRQLHGVAVGHAVQAADGAEDHAVVDIGAAAGLRQPRQHIRAGAQPHGDDSRQISLRHLQNVIH